MQFTHSVLSVLQVAHKASTRERHCCRFAACLVMVSQVSRHAFISFSMVLRQVSLARPLFRFLSGVQHRAILGNASCGIRHTCLCHLHLLFFTVWVRDFTFVLWCGSSLDILLGQKILRIFCFQHSAPYSKTPRTLLLKTLSLVLVPTCFDFQMFFSMAKNWFALVTLELISLSESPSVAILLPRYVNSFTLSMSLLFMVTVSFDL